jgi:hypothetical protein
VFLVLEYMAKESNIIFNFIKEAPVYVKLLHIDHMFKKLSVYLHEDNWQKDLDTVASKR